MGFTLNTYYELFLNLIFLNKINFIFKMRNCACHTAFNTNILTLYTSREFQHLFKHTYIETSVYCYTCLLNCVVTHTPHETLTIHPEFPQINNCLLYTSRCV